MHLELLSLKNWPSMSSVSWSMGLAEGDSAAVLYASEELGFQTLNLFHLLRKHLNTAAKNTFLLFIHYVTAWIEGRKQKPIGLRVETDPILGMKAESTLALERHDSSRCSCLSKGTSTRSHLINPQTPLTKPRKLLFGICSGKLDNTHVVFCIPRTPY